MEKIITDDYYDYFIKVVQPKISKLKVQDPFDNYEFKPLLYYNKKVWDVMNFPKSDSESERVARARSFSLAKQKVYFNKDLRYFITLTYAKNMQDYDKLKSDIKGFLNAERRKGKIPKYLWVVEKQKRGALHVHMICNDFFTVKKNRYNKLSIPTWNNGFTNVEEIKVRDSFDTDVNFKPFLYMYKYMNKSQKIGGRYIHSSKNLNNFSELKDFDLKQLYLTKIHSEISKMGTLDSMIKRTYYESTN